MFAPFFIHFIQSYGIKFSMNKVFDLHNDFILKYKNDIFLKRHLSENFKNGLQNVMAALWTTELQDEDIIAGLNRITELSKTDNRISLAIEDLHFLSKCNIRNFFNYAPKYCSLTWNEENNLAGGAFSDQTLTSFGKYVLDIMEQNNIILDTAHLNEKSFMAVAINSNKPIICSHTAVYNVHSHPRNLKDYQIRIILESKGVIGVCLVSDFLNGKKSSLVSDYIKHIDYIANKFGVQGLCIGTDFNGTDYLPKNIKSNYIGLSEVENGLLKLGYSTAAISNIFYDNASNFFNG